MSYCIEKETATVIYKFNDGEEKRFVVEKENLPVDVAEEKVKKSSGIETNFSQSFDGDNPGSYAFTINAPQEVPTDVEVDVYLKNGTWDDYGGVGNFSTGYGIVMGYEGDPLLVGTGRSIDGTVTNVEPIECYANITLDWRYENACKLIVSHEGKILYEEIGDCPLKFEVVCDKDCPPGYLKCKSNKYPGYCCLPCKPTANKIRALGDKL